MNIKLIAVYILGGILGVVVMGAAVFWSAGRVDWWPGWAAILVWLGWYATMDIIVIRYKPELLRERLMPPKDAKTWDKRLLSVVRLIQLARYILAGLDQRYGWTIGFPAAAQIAGLALCVLSNALFFWALANNRFFSEVVRIQSERDHRVASGGPYRYVRHPGYAGMLVFELALGLLLASWWAIIGSGICAGLFIVRTALEDRTLQAELPGYAEYARQVRYRLLPGVW